MTRRWWFRGGLAAALLALIPVLAEADCARPPQVQARSYLPVGGLGIFSVFGTRTLDRGQLSIGAGYLGDEAVCQQEAGYADFHTFFLSLGYGVTDRLSVGIDIPYSRQESDRAKADERGLDDVNVGVTYRLLDEAVGRPAIGIVGFAALPTADEDKGLGTGKADVGFKLIVSKTLLPNLVGHVNVGYTVVGDTDEFKRRNEVTGGVGAEYAFTSRLSALAEVVANTNREDGRRLNGDPQRASDYQAVGRAGFRYVFNEWLTGSIGLSAGFTSDSPNRGVFALLTAVWPPRPGGVAAPTSAPTPSPLAGPGAPGVGAAPGAAVPGAPGPGAGVPGAPGAPGAPGVGAAPGAAVPPGPSVGVPGAPGAPGAPIPGAPGVAALPPSAVASLTRQGLLDTHFAFDRYDLTDETKATLQALSTFLSQNPGVTLAIEGHADERGTAEYNLALGEKRAQAVKDYLVNLGVTANRLSTVSYGEERPLDPGHTELAWAMNRRAHFLLRAR